MEPTSREKVTDKIFEQMRQMIASGKWAAGERLPSEHKLMEMFNASRISIREPLKRLAGLGLVESKHGAGTFVRGFNEDSFIAPIQPVLLQTPTKQDVLHILEVRQIEIVAADLAAQHCDKDEVEKLRQIQACMDTEKITHSIHHRVDLDFHLQICRMTKNPYFFSVCRLLYDLLDAVLETVVRIMGPEKALYYHPLLIDAIAGGHSAKARGIMREHLLTTLEAVRAMPEDADVFRLRAGD